MFVCENAAGNEGTGFVAKPDEVLGFLEALLLHGENSRGDLLEYVDEVVELAANGTAAAITRGQ
jgi:hypothetical protein